MKQLFIQLFVMVFLFTACEEDNNITKDVNATGIYVVNFGNYSGTVGSVSALNLKTNEIENNVFKTANSTADVEIVMSGNPQFAYEYKGQIYFMGNNLDEIYSINKYTLKQESNGVTKDIVKPRFCVGYGDYLYISCWGGNIWSDTSLSYIAKFNVKTNSVDEKIALAGGPEGLSIVGGQLYCALNYDNKIAVMDLETEQFVYIENLPGVGSYFIKDKNDNLYATIVGSYSVETTNTGLIYIKTEDNSYDFYELPNVSQGYSSIIAANSQCSKLYIVSSTFDANWNPVGGVNVFDVETKSFNSTPFVSGVSGINAIAVDPKTNNFYLMVSESTTSSGKLQVYNESGIIQTSYETGIAPAWMLFED